MDTNLKSTEAKGTDVFKGAISWICSLLLLCGLTTGLLVLLFIALDPQLAGGLGEAFINLTYGEYPRVAAGGGYQRHFVCGGAAGAAVRLPQGPPRL